MLTCCLAALVQPLLVDVQCEQEVWIPQRFLVIWDLAAPSSCKGSVQEKCSSLSAGCPHLCLILQLSGKRNIIISTRIEMNQRSWYTVNNCETRMWQIKDDKTRPLASYSQWSFKAFLILQPPPQDINKSIQGCKGEEKCCNEVCWRKRSHPGFTKMSHLERKTRRQTR